ncbi:MAG TPA: XTP/dITP diphosphatase [Nitrospiraceae bacterium]|nr:XTP/dITP diphosphatase [Nitrospiraceae bacterium]
MNELVLATRNIHKGAEVAVLLSDLGIKILTLADFPNAPQVIEDGLTCEANAIKKASTIASYTGLPAVADDTGLMVDALNGRPGIYAARYAGEQATYEENWRKLLQDLEGVPYARRTARFITVAAVSIPLAQRTAVAEGILEGIIADRPAGTEGFGYDPIFFVPQLGKTLAQLSYIEKNRISHRAKAFRQAKEIIRGAENNHVGA